MSGAAEEQRERPWKFDKFTARARQVLAFAEEEARRLNHHYIGTEHFLLGLAMSDVLAARVLHNLGVEPAQVRDAVEYAIGRGDAPATGPLALTPRAKKVIELAVDEARRLNHHYIGTEHLLLGLLRGGEGVGAGVLQSLGLTETRLRDEIVAEVARQRGPSPVESVRDKVVRALAKRGRGAEAPEPKSNVVTCRIDDRDLDALDALVEAGIRSTRSDAASWLIHAGIEAHQDLFAKVYATVGQIRQLRSEAQAIAQQHEGGEPAPPALGVEPPAEPPAAGPAAPPSA